jgi:acyl-CoA thioester hydrolase
MATLNRTVVEVPVEVRYAETDQMGVVHHRHHIVWFELARTRLCAATGITYPEIEAMGYFLMLSEVHVRYRSAVRYGDTAQVRCFVAEISSRSLRFAYEIRVGERLAATGETAHLWVRREDMKPVRLPEPLREGFVRVAGDAVRPPLA